jgi:methionine-rich copper-binding protein CopC
LLVVFTVATHTSQFDYWVEIELLTNLFGPEVYPTNMKNSKSFRVGGVFWGGLLVVFAAIVLLVPRAAWAHAILVRSSPALNSTIEGPNLDVEMKFSSRVDGARSTMLLSASDGKSKPLAIEHQSSPDTLTTHVTQLGPGKYSIRWQVLATDGHVTRGEIPFNVK